MEISATSLLHLLRNISEAVSGKKSATDYDNLLRKIFEEGVSHEEALTDSETKDLIDQDALLSSEEVSGRDNEKKLLLSKLLDTDDENGVHHQLPVIPIIGGSGSGKTALARLVYEDEVVKEHFQLRAWVRVDGHQLGLHHAALGILKSATGMSCAIDDLDELDEIVRDTLQSNRCLIVFDGIESMAEDSWLHMNENWFSVVDLGSKALITSPNADDVANLVANQNQPLELARLSHDVSWSLCRHLAYDSSEGVEDIMPSPPLAKNVAALCGGVPLSIKLLRSLMGCDDKLRNLLFSVDFADSISMSPSDASLVILLCVWALPSHLRQCFAYCSVFPKGYTLNKEKIILMWIAEGLLEPDIATADACFRLLLNRSFFTDITHNQYGDVVKFRIPGLIHKIAHDVASIFFKEKLGVIGSICEDAGGLSLVIPMTEKYNAKGMRTLILSPTIYMSGVQDHSLVEFTDLRSLDLSCSGIRDLSDDICTLKELRYLNLSYTLIERLPDSITDLSRLQTLDLSWCYHLKVLPEGMRMLTEMRHLDLSRCESLSDFPSGIGSLKSLSSMPLFVLGKDHDCALLGELGMLDKLRGRLEIRNLENVMEISEARKAMLKRKSLDHLGLSWSRPNADHCYETLKLLEPNQQLKVLDLTGYMGLRFPEWISSINSLVKISINDCGCQELPASIGRLSFLKELQLKGMRNIKRIGPEFYGGGDFLSLEQLGLYDMPNLLQWKAETVPDVYGIELSSSQCVFRNLKTLTIEGCPQLESLPSLPTLPDLIACNSNHRILSSLTTFGSLSSLLIKDMELGMHLNDLFTLSSLKKLILFSIKDLDTTLQLRMAGFNTDLEHLGILRCQQLTDIRLLGLTSLKKLHIVNCRNLRNGLVRPLDVDHPTLMELVVDDCHVLECSIIQNLHLSLRKLIIKCCGEFNIETGDFRYLDFRYLRKLEYLFISGCPQLERELEMEPSVISHIPCVILGNQKANFYYKDIKDTREVQIQESDESKYNRGSKPDFEKSALWNLSQILRAPFYKFASGITKLRSDTAVVTPTNPSSSTKPSTPGTSRSNSNGGCLSFMSGSARLIQFSTALSDDACLAGDILPTPNMKIYTYADLKNATRNFKSCLGVGDFGTVYKGWVDEKTLVPSKAGTGMVVAIKMLNPHSSQGFGEWQAEVNFLGRLSHPNLVKLLGYCWEDKELLLVYEFMPRGSLENHLFRRDPAVEPLSWDIRLKIAIGTARGLAFLHTSDKQVIYRDFKASNILLDVSYNAKISYFGLVEMGPSGGNSHVTTQVMGTYVYAAPEYIATGHLYVKSVVYGFGVVLLEILTGLRAHDLRRPNGQQNLVDWLKPILSQRRKLKIIMDVRMEGQYSSKAALQAAQLALECLESEPTKRPPIKQVVEVLEQIAAMAKPKQSNAHSSSHHQRHHQSPRDPSYLDIGGR